jgi:hypothetical protein
VRVSRGSEVAIDRVHLVHVRLGDRVLDLRKAWTRRVGPLEIVKRGDRLGVVLVPVEGLGDPELDLLGPGSSGLVIDELAVPPDGGRVLLVLEVLGGGGVDVVGRATSMTLGPQPAKTATINASNA